MNTNLLLLTKKPFKHLQTTTSVPFASSVLFQTEILKTEISELDTARILLKGIISISLPGKKQFLRYQPHFSPLLTLPERTNPRVCKFCLLFAGILKSANTIKAIFSSWVFIFAFIPLHLSSDAEFQAVLRNPSPASLHYQSWQDCSTICQAVLFHPLSITFISFKKFMGNPNSIHHITHPNIPLCFLI